MAETRRGRSQDRARVASMDGCHRHVYPDARIYTYWVNAHAFSRDHGFRMDFLLLSAEATSRLIAAGVDTAYRGREKPSDHAPTWVHLSEASNER